MKYELSSGDLFGCFMLWEEGWMINRLLDHLKAFPSSTPILMLIMIPFLALTEHDGIKFVNKVADEPIPRDGERVHKIRNQMKSLGAKGIRFDEYSKETNDLLVGMSGAFKSHKGFLSKLSNAIQPDVGVYYYKYMPIGSTYSIARYMLDRESARDMLDNGIETARDIGFEFGKAGAFFHALAEQLFPEKGVIRYSEFVTQSNDVHLDGLLKPLASQGINDPAAFFFLTDLMMQINAIFALSDAGFFTRRLVLKYMTAALFNGLKSVRSFTRYAHGEKCSVAFSEDTVRRVDAVFSRATAKKVEKLEPLRHALVHYDFSAFPSTGRGERGQVDDALVQAVRCQMDMQVEGFEQFLIDAGQEVVANIIELTRFPGYRQVLDPDWQATLSC